jgi:hypothetical protein
MRCNCAIFITIKLFASTTHRRAPANPRVPDDTNQTPKPISTINLIFFKKKINPNISTRKDSFKK